VYLYFQDQEITYEELDRKANQVAKGFLESGIRKGDKVSLLLPNYLEFLYPWFGLNKMGAVRFAGGEIEGEDPIKVIIIP
jgi:crotonobetaine/carnitine-CoA ligase